MNTFRKVHTITTALTSTHGVHARMAPPALGLPPSAGASDDAAGTGTGTGTLSSPIAVEPSVPILVPTKLARYWSISRGFQNWTNPMTQRSETIEASTSGNCGLMKLETTNCVRANEPPATNATGHTVLKLRKPVKMMMA